MKAAPSDTGEVNAMELTQAYLGYRFGDAFAEGAHADVQAGRFPMDLGSRRLVGRNNFRNTTNAFTGARFDWVNSAQTQLTLFYTLPHTRRPDDKASILDNEVEWDLASEDIVFWGAFASTRGLPLGARGEAFVFALDEQDFSDRQTCDRQLITPGVRVYRDAATGAWDFEIEAGVQSGEARASASPADLTDLDVEASYAHVEFGRTWDAPWQPRLALEYDFASGDRSPTDGEYNRFDSLYGTLATISVQPASMARLGAPTSPPLACAWKCAPTIAGTASSSIARSQCGVRFHRGLDTSAL